MNNALEECKVTGEATAEIIRCENINKKFKSKTVLEDVSFDVHRGEFLSLLGPSGCGKTTILRMLIGIEKPSSGRIIKDGVDVTFVAPKDRNIGIVFQSYALFPTMTVRDNIAFGLKIKKQNKEEITRKVNEIARKVDLTDEQLAKAVSQLSGGQQQRVAIARALVTEPTIICMDEPLSNLDAKLRVQLRNELKRMQKEFGITTIYVTHDQEEALTLSDRIAVFNKGYIEQIGTPNEIYNHSDTEFVANFIGDINKLQDGIVSALGLDPDKSHYIRLERINVRLANSKLAQQDAAGKVGLFSGVVESQEYYGLFIKYTIQTAGQILKVVEKNGSLSIFEPGDEVNLYIDPVDIMSY